MINKQIDLKAFDEQASTVQASQYDQERINESTAMDAETFQPLMVSIRREIFSVEQKIKCFTTSDVSLDLKEEIPSRLEKIDECNVICQEKIFGLIISLDANVPSNLDKTNALRKLADDLNSKVRTNSVQVREKLSDLIKNTPTGASTNPKSFDLNKKLNMNLI